MSQIRLRPVADDDLLIFYEHQRDAGASTLAAVPARDRDAHLAHWRTKVLGDPAVTVRTIEADGEVAGHVTSFVRDGERLVGYWIAREHWGRGIASRALAQFLAAVVTERPLHADVAAHNGASLRVLEKCGFEVVEVRQPESNSGGVHLVRLVLRIQSVA